MVTTAGLDILTNPRAIWGRAAETIAKQNQGVKLTAAEVEKLKGDVKTGINSGTVPTEAFIKAESEREFQMPARAKAAWDAAGAAAEQNNPHGEQALIDVAKKDDPVPTLSFIKGEQQRLGSGEEGKLLRYMSQTNDAAVLEKLKVTLDKLPSIKY